MKPHITQEKLKDVLHYDPITGIFTWRVSPTPRIKAGGRAGTSGAKRKGGESEYRYIQIFYRTYSEHRLAYFYMKGESPYRVDHRDGNGLRNVFTNLRPCSSAQNSHNRKLGKRIGSSGLKGASLRDDGRWVSSITFEGKRKFLGYFATAEEAHGAYCSAADEIFGDFSNHGTHKQQKAA